MPATGEIKIYSCQRTRRIDQVFLRSFIRWLVDDELGLGHVEIAIHLFDAAGMAGIHKEFMGITGSTDVITFDHGSEPPGMIYGEIFVGVDDAVSQARTFKTTWQSEIARYVIHGILHLLRYDDLEPKARLKMKREEGRLVRLATKYFPLRNLAKR